MKRTIRNRAGRFLAVAAQAVALALVAAPAAQAQKYPAKPIRMIVPSAPGGGLDIVARNVAQQLGARLGQSVVVDYIAGASQQLGTQAMVRSNPDGYTLLFTASSPITIAENFEPKPTYDARKEIAGLAIVARNPGIFVINSGIKANTMAEFVALAKAQPGVLNFGSPGTGHVFHLITEQFAKQAGINMTHIPYKGSAPAIVALMGGQIQFMVQSAEAVREQIRAGKLRALATLEPTRLERLPDIPTMTEAGQQPINLTIWYGILAPAKTPVDVQETLERELLAMARNPEFTGKLKDMNFVPVAEGRKEFAQRMSNEFEVWPALVKSIGVGTTR